jgi:hypothetical protein
MKPTNLNPLFIDQIQNFAHLVTIYPQTKEKFLAKIKEIYSFENPKTQLFYVAAQKSDFDTIKLSADRNNILFNH